MIDQILEMTDPGDYASMTAANIPDDIQVAADCIKDVTDFEALLAELDRRRIVTLQQAHSVSISLMMHPVASQFIGMPATEENARLVAERVSELLTSVQRCSVWGCNNPATTWIIGGQGTEMVCRHHE